MKDKWQSQTDGEVSLWNEAMFKMRRLNQIQEEINRCKMYLLGKHWVTGQWNYIVWFNAVNSLFGEGESKYSNEEKEEIRKIRNLIEEELNVHPPHEVQVSQTINGKKFREVLNKERFANIKKLITLFESQVKLYNDKHGLSTANKDNIDAKSILR